MIARLLIVGAVIVALVVGGLAVKRDVQVEVVCGPSVSTPLGTRVLDGADQAGSALRQFMEEPTSEYALIRFTFKVFKFLRTTVRSFKNAVNGAPADKEAEGWRQRSREAQRLALASCCPGAPPPPDTPDVAPQEPEAPWDPKSASLQSTSSKVQQRQVAILRKAISVRKAKELPPRADLIITITGLVESEIANLNYGDRDSLGWLQQRPSQGWGSKAQVQDVHYASAKFFEALLRVRGWESRPVGVVAQAVQRSAFPHRYAQRVDEAQRLLVLAGGRDGEQVEPAPATTPNLDCPALAGDGDGDVSGEITPVAVLNPQGAGNWQGAVSADNHWYVAHAADNDARQVFHRLNSAGREVDQMVAVGFAHTTSFAVHQGNVYATDGQGRVVTFPYQPGKTIRSGKPTGWRGLISVDPAGGTAVIRNGNKYRAYNLTTRKPVGVQVTIDTGPRQGFSISGRILYVLTGSTNQPARVDTYSFTTGAQTGTRDITHLGADRAGAHREPEGMWGNQVGIKVNTGTRRRLLVFSIGGAETDTPGGGSTPAVFNQQGNPRTVEQAVASLERMENARTPIRVNMCSRYMAQAYGWPNSGSPTALTLWQAIPDRLKHPGKSAPPRGALVFWRTGAYPGHVAISLGDGMIATTDVPRGRIGIVPIAKIDAWGPRQGWAAPHWPTHSKGVQA